MVTLFSPAFPAPFRSPSVTSGSALGDEDGDEEGGHHGAPGFLLDDDDDDDEEEEEREALIRKGASGPLAAAAPVSPSPLGKDPRKDEGGRGSGRSSGRVSRSGGDATASAPTQLLRFIDEVVTEETVEDQVGLRECWG